MMWKVGPRKALGVFEQMMHATQYLRASPRSRTEEKILLGAPRRLPRTVEHAIGRHRRYDGSDANGGHGGEAADVQAGEGVLGQDLLEHDGVSCEVSYWTDCRRQRDLTRSAAAGPYSRLS